jgi:hypothetical protein
MAADLSFAAQGAAHRLRGDWSAADYSIVDSKDKNGK